MQDKEFIQTFVPQKEAAYRVALYMLESPDAAMDAVQDMYLKLWDMRDALDSIRDPRAYCTRMVRNICIDRIRSAERSAPESEIPDGTDPPPDEALQSRERLRAVLKAIETLSPKERMLLRLKVFDGLSYKEMESVTGIPQLSLRVQVSLARRKLKIKTQRQ